MLYSGDYDMIILDEINVAIDYGLIKLKEVLKLVHNKPLKVELILTGRDAHPEIIEAADVVTEMKQVKHYYDRGIQARVGIER